MKKKDLLKLIEAKYKIINNNQFINALAFPKIDDLENEFGILKKEIETSREAVKIGKEIIDSYNCNHPVRLIHYGTFWSTSYCVFCDKGIDSDNVSNWEYSKNRNKYCVILDDKEQEDEDDYYIIEDGYTINQVFKIILEIIKDKNDDEDIDLIQEFKKLNLNNCKINEEPKINENYILILSGSNKQYIDDESFITKKAIENGIDFAEFFSGILNTKIELIDNFESKESLNFKNKFMNHRNFKFTSYKTIDELNEKLNNDKKIPFKIIIDLSELYNYDIENNSIIKEPININLNEIFPDSKIIKIKNLTKKSLEELSKFLKENIDINNLYGYKDESYYYLENNEINKNNLENTCNKIKKLLRN